MRSVRWVAVAVALCCCPGLAAAAGSRIYAARVGTDGQPVGSAVEVAPPDSGVQENPRVAYRDGVFLVVWQDLRNGTDPDVLAARISAAGEVLDATPLTIAAGARSQSMPDVAADDEGFMVVWHGYQGTDRYPRVYAARVGTDGTVGDATVVADGSNPRIAWNGAQYVVAYETAYSQTNPGLYVKWIRMDKAKTVQNGTGYRKSGGEGPHRYALAAMPSAAAGFTLVETQGLKNFWGGSCAETAANIKGDGSLGSSENLDYWGPYSAACSWGGAAVATDASYTVALWQRYHMGGFSAISMNNADLYAARVDAWDPVDPAGGVAIATSPASERNPDLAGNGAGTMLAVYEKLVAGRTQIASRLLTVGTSIDVGEEVIIMNDAGPGGGRRANPAVAFGAAPSGGTAVFLAVWQEGWHGDTSLGFSPPVAGTTRPTPPRGIRKYDLGGE